jgi:hypothetical protein
MRAARQRGVQMTANVKRGRRRRMPGSLVVGLCLGLAVAAWAQEPKDRPLALGYISPNQTIINGQVRLALEYERQARSLLPSVGSPGVLAEARQLVYDGYAMVRFAEAGTQHNSEQSKFVNPLLKLQFDAMVQIRAKLRTCMTELANVAAGQADQLPPARQCVTVVIGDIETLLAGML